MLLICTVLLVGTVSALEWDNKLSYSEEDLKVELKNWFGLGKNYGSAKLMSHKSVTEVREVSVGEQVVMWYDFNFTDLYESGIGDVEFIDVGKGETINKDYSFVYWGTEQRTREVEDLNNCKSTFVNGTKYNCPLKTENYSYEGWLTYNSRDVPAKLIRIGLLVDVEPRQIVDAVWTIGGKKATKHAQYSGVGEHSNDIVNLDANIQDIKIKLNALSNGVITEVQLGSGDSGSSTSNVSIWQNDVRLAYVSQSAWKYDTAPLVKLDLATNYSDVIYSTVDNGNFYIIVNKTAGANMGAKNGDSEFNGTLFEYASQQLLAKHSSQSARPIFTFNGTIPDDSSPVVTDHYPVNNSNFSVSTITANATASDDVNLTKVEWYIDGTLNQTNSSQGLYNNSVFTFSTSLSDGTYTIQMNATDNATTPFSTTGNLTYINIDTTAPVQNFIFPKANTNSSTVTLPVSLTMNVSVQDSNIDLCWWSNNSYSTNNTYACNTNQSVTFTNEGQYTIYHCSNDTFGFQTCGSISNWIHFYQFTEEADPSTTAEGFPVDFTLFLNRTDIEDDSAILEFNNTNYSTPVRTAFTNYTKFTQQVIIPSGWGNTTGRNLTSQWYFNISGIVKNVTSGVDVNVTSVAIDNCTTYGDIILNFTLLDEELRTFTHTGQLIETDVRLQSPVNLSQTWNYSVSRDNVNTTQICVPAGMLNNAWFTMNTTTRYEAGGYVTEFHYLDRYNLTNASGQQNISLHALNSSDSTSFLVEYQNEDYLPVENAIVDLLRFYVGEGVYRSVEHGRTDENGQTVLHFVTEEVQYRAVVRVEGDIDYTSPDFLALCQETPCQINLQKQDDVSDVFNYEEFSNLVYSLTLNETSRNVTLTFATRDGSSSSVILNVTQWDAYLNNSICTETLTSSAGTMVCNIPLTATNSTYYVKVTEDGNFVVQSSFGLSPNAFDNFGYTGIIMVGILFLTLVLMAVPSGAIATLVFGVIGLIFASILTLFQGGSVIGVGAPLMWLIIAIVIIIVKIANRNRHS